MRVNRYSVGEPRILSYPWPAHLNIVHRVNRTLGLKGVYVGTESASQGELVRKRGLRCMRPSKEERHRLRASPSFSFLSCRRGWAGRSELIVGVCSATDFHRTSIPIVSRLARFLYLFIRPRGNPDGGVVVVVRPFILDVTMIVLICSNIGYVV
jgi:hypothetical protein